MRMLYYIIIVGLMLLAPVKRLDVAKLEPVEAVAVTVNDGCVMLETDTESIGVGRNAEEAVTSLRKNAKGIIYLDTARFLLVGDNAEEAAMQMKTHLRRSVHLAAYDGGNVKEQTEYMEAHNFRTKPE